MYTVCVVSLCVHAVVVCQERGLTVWKSMRGREGGRRERISVYAHALRLHALYELACTSGIISYYIHTVHVH